MLRRAQPHLRVWALGLLLTAGLPAVAASPARADVIERVVGVVNDRAIFLSQLRRRAVPFLPQVMEAETDTERRARLDQLYGQILDQLIDDELIQDAANTMQVRVSSDDVNRAIANVRRQSNMSEGDFWNAVRAQGFTEAQYRSDVRRQLLRLKVLNQRVRGRVNITEDDVRQKYAQLARREQGSLRFRLSHLFFEVPSGSSATELAAIRERAQAVRQGLTPAGFEAAIAAHAGGELGWLTQGDLPPALEQAVLELAPEGISPPVRGPSGLHILLLQEREQGAGAIPPFEQARDDIYRAMLEEAMQRQQGQLLEELRRGATVSRRLN